MKKNLLLSFLLLSFVVLKAQVDDNQIAKDLVIKNSKSIGLSNQDLSNYIISNTYFDNASKLRMVYLQQSYLNIPVYNQIQVLAFKDHSLVSNSGGRISSIEKITKGNTGKPIIAADNAVMTAIADRKLITQRNPFVLETKKGGNYIVFDNMGISRENITAELMWVPSMDGKNIFLSWQVYIIPSSSSDYWMIRVNAMDNSIVSINNLTVFCNWDNPSNENVAKNNSSIQNKKDKKNLISTLNFDFLTPEIKSQNSPSLINNATYRVIPFPAESPIHPGGSHDVRTNPWASAPGNATTLKWHNTGTTDYIYTRGNNVWAKEDRSNTNGTGNPATSTTSADPLSFDFTPTFTVTPTQTTPVKNQQFNITNLFYWNNIIHDVMYLNGFDEVSGNFQATNLGRGGLGNDFVFADAQDGGGTNNANFATPADGGNGRMQMYLWNGNPQKDGDVDNGIVCHEAAHGISNRLTGGPAQAGCLSNNENMGEGWSDYYGLMLTQNWATSTLNTGFASPRGVGTYAIGQQSTATGIRSQKYCTNFSINNKVYAISIPAESHDRGEIWCATLWDMTWNIINQVGNISTTLYDVNGTGGNIIALKLVTEGMKLQPCSPGFIDGRDAILQADQLLYNGVHQCAILEAFRRRGMGAFASQGSSGSVTDQVPDFSIGNASLSLTQSITQVIEGQSITYTNKIVTGDCGGITNFTLTDTLPANVTYVSGGTYNSANRVVSFSITLAAGQTQTYSFTVNANSGSYYPTVSLFQDSANGPTIPATWTTTNTMPNGIWSISTARSYSSNSSYFSNNLDTTSDQRLILTNAISLGATPPPLSFRHWFNCESTYDGGVLEASINGGTTWTDMQPNIILGGYLTTMDATTLLAGRRAWSGSSNNKWTKTKVNLTPYANQNLKIRFRFTSDVGTNLEGWYVDDIAIKNQAVIEMQSNLYNSSNVRVATSDTFTIILPVNTCTAAVISTEPNSANVCSGSSTTFVTAATGSNNSYQWQVSTNNGATYTNISGETNPSLTLNNVSTLLDNNRYRVIASNSCPSKDTSAIAVLNVSTPASISIQPENQNICQGNDAVFSITTNSNTNTYQWQVSTDNGVSFSDITGATNPTLTLNNVTNVQNNNQYHVVVSTCTPGGLISSNVILTVNSPASIATQPVNTSACPNGNASFNANCIGTSLTYQWQVSIDGGNNYTDITGETNSILNLTNVTSLMDNYKYRVLVNSTACPGEVISNEALLTISNSAVITTQPLDNNTCSGANALFSISASGSGLVYQWQISTDGGVTFSNITGETNAALTVSNVTTAMEGNLYHVVLSNSCSAIGTTSDNAILHVIASPLISSQPSDVITCINTTAQFTASATGNALSYQWQLSTDGGATFTDITGETNNTFSITNVDAAMNNNKYRLVVTSLTCGSIFSGAVLLTVVSPATISTQPTNVSICENTDAVFNVTASGTSITYQWQLSTDGGLAFTNITGANNSSLTLPAVSSSQNNYQYQVVISEISCADITSDAATLIVNNLPVVLITASPSPVVLPRETITLTASATPASTVFSWYKNGTIINGQTGSSIIINDNGAGSYTASVIDGNGCSNNSNTLVVRDTVLNYTFIYPNPNKGYFQVRFDGIPYNGQPRFITMYDAKGARVFSKSYTVSAPYEVMDVNAEKFSRGVYSLVLSDANGTTLATGKVVIQ